MIKLLGDQVAVEPIFDSDKTASGLLYIPDQAKERCDQGIIKYLGPDVEDLCPGDYAIFSGYVGRLVEIDGELLIIMRERFVQAVIQDIPETDIPGLYFKGADGEYFPATYEYVFGFVTSALKNEEWRRKMKINVPKPTKEDYDEGA
jgi:co-chaperonin GroES (HSP10)